MGASNSQPEQTFNSNYMSSDQVKANIREMFRLNKTNNVSPFSVDTIGFNAKLNGANTDEQTGGQVGGQGVPPTVNRYDAVLKELGMTPQQSDDNMVFSSDKLKEISPKMEELQNLRNMIASKSSQSGGCGGSCGGDVAYSATSPNAIDYSVLKGGEHKEDDKKDDKEHNKDDDKKKKDKHKEHKDDDESIDLDEDDDEDFEDDDDEDGHEMSRIMDDSSDDSSTASTESTDSSSTSSSDMSSSSSEKPKKQNKMKRHSASIEHSKNSEDVKAVAFYSSEDANEHMKRLKRKNRF